MQFTTARETLEEGNSSAASLDFSELFREYYPRIYNYLRYRTHTPEDAEDLISMTFEKAYTHRMKYDASKASFSTWIFQIAHNTLANYYRSRQRRSNWETTAELPVDAVLPEASPEAQVIQKEALLKIRGGLAQLSDRDQEVISLKFAGRLSNQEIGQIMDLNEKHVSVVLLRAMRRLQKQVMEITR